MHIHPVVWRGVALPKSNYPTPWTPEQILKSIEFGPEIQSPKYPNHASAMPYFHSIASAGKYLILPVGGTILDIMPMLRGKKGNGLAYFDANLCFALLIYSLIRLASLRLIISEAKWS